MNQLIDQALRFLDKRKRQSGRCVICGKLNFLLETKIDEWMAKPRIAYDLSNDQKRFLQAEILKRYRIDEPTCGMDTHHISYVMDITMPVCSDCHKKIHHSDEKPWADYKPIDNRNDPKMYENITLR